MRRIEGGIQYIVYSIQIIQYLSVYNLYIGGNPLKQLLKCACWQEERRKERERVKLGKRSSRLASCMTVSILIQFCLKPTHFLGAVSP